MKDAPALLTAAGEDIQRLAWYARHTLSRLDRGDLPAGARVNDAWILMLPKKLESPNKTIWRHWRVLKRERDQWEALIRTVVVDLLGCASWGAVVTLGRQPQCTMP